MVQMDFCKCHGSLQTANSLYGMLTVYIYIYMLADKQLHLGLRLSLSSNNPKSVQSSCDPAQDGWPGNRSPVGCEAPCSPWNPCPSPCTTRLVSPLQADKNVWRRIAGSSQFLRERG